MKKFLFIFLILFPSGLFAFQPKTVVHLSFGSYSQDADDVSLTGSDFSVGAKYYSHPNFAYFGSAGSGQSTGVWTSTDETMATEVSENHAEVVGGVEVRSQVIEKPSITPFIGLGLKVQSYSYDFNYVGSDIGETSGVGYGPIANVGVRLGLGRNFTIIPNYYFSTMTITGENSDFTVISSGLQVSLVAGF
ncbi:MAG: hypothetical protein QNL04_00435 [SAR324 cluster bacterium]|nr:hypothetical protein [SAR324 cluster bacterium]